MKFLDRNYYATRLNTIHVFDNALMPLFEHFLETSEIDSRIEKFKWTKNESGSITLSYEVRKKHDVYLPDQIGNFLVSFLNCQKAVAASMTDWGYVSFRMEGVEDTIHITDIARGELATDALRLLLDLKTNGDRARHLIEAHEIDLDTLLEGNYRLIEQMDGDGFL